MKSVLKFFFGSFSTSLFIALMLLITIKFELLNKSFLFGSFEKHNVYAQLPTLLADSLPKDQAEFAKNISPQIVKSLIEDNLTQVIDFANGDSKDIIISFSLQGLGFENASGIRWSIAQIPDKDLQEKIKSLNGAGNTLTIAIGIILAILVGLFWLSGKTILLSGGVYIVATGLIGKFSLITIGKELINGQEISQKIMGLLSNSLFPDIINTWLIMGGVLILIWLAMKIKAHAILNTYQKNQQNA